MTFTTMMDNPQSDECSDDYVKGLKVTGYPRQSGKIDQKVEDSEIEMTKATRFIKSQVEQKDWYHGRMERGQAEAILKNGGVGGFLVRYSHKPAVPDEDGYLQPRDRIVLSVRCKSRIQHMQINATIKDDDLKDVYLTDVKKKSAGNVYQLLIYYKKQSLAHINNNLFSKEDYLTSYAIKTTDGVKFLPFIEDMGRETNLIHPYERERDHIGGDIFSVKVEPDGSIIQMPDSDVQLIIPAGAVPEGHVYEIEYLLHVTDLYKFKKHRVWSEHEHFISPIPEFTIVRDNGRCVKGGDVKFSKFVDIRIPHCIKKPDDLKMFDGSDQEEPTDIQNELNHIRVYSSNPEKKQLGVEVPRKSVALTTDDCYFETERDFVIIHTLHFTQYICTHDNTFNLHVEILLFGRYTNAVFQETHFKVYVCEALFRLKEHKLGIIAKERALGRVLMEQVSMKLPDEVRHSDNFQIHIVPDAHVSHRDGSDWRPNVAPGMSGQHVMAMSAILECYHVCMGGMEGGPEPIDISLSMRNHSEATAISFSGHLETAVLPPGRLVPSAQVAHNNSYPFTLELNTTVSGASRSPGSSISE